MTKKEKAIQIALGIFDEINWVEEYSSYMKSDS
jgi:hypothetical protein